MQQAQEVGQVVLLELIFAERNNYIISTICECNNEVYIPASLYLRTQLT